MREIRKRIAPLFILCTTIGCLSSVSAKEEAIPCEVHLGACIAIVSGQMIQLEILPRPVSAMTDLTFRVALYENGTDEDRNLYIDLDMPGMNMGPNRVHLKRVSSGIYEGKGIIVRCPSGKRTWQAAVTVSGQGVITFIFDVRH